MELTCRRLTIIEFALGCRADKLKKCAKNKHDSKISNSYVMHTSKPAI